MSIPVQCSHCHRVYENGVWIDKGYKDNLPRHSHGDCPPCHRKFMQEIADWKKKNETK